MTTQVLWTLGEQEAADALGELLEGVALVPVHLNAPTWPLPRRSRPIGVVIVVGERTVAETARLIQAVRKRSHMGILLLTWGNLPPADSHILLRAGATGIQRSPTDPTLSSGARNRAVMRWRRQVKSLTEQGAADKARPRTKEQPPALLAIGSSTGGPQTLKEILTGPPFKVPLLISQHIRPGYAGELAHWLSDCGAPTRVAKEGDVPTPGVALLAPGDRDMALVDGQIELRPASATAVPSVDVLFESVSHAVGAKAAGILLTGMGRDGARGLLALRQAGAFTVAQRGDTCVVNGMPQAARDLEAAWESWSPEEIRSYLQSLRQGARSSAA